MSSHEKLCVYCLSIEIVAWAYNIAKTFDMDQIILLLFE